MQNLVQPILLETGSVSEQFGVKFKVATLNDAGCLVQIDRGNGWKDM